MSAAAATSSSPKEGNYGSSVAASASNIHVQLFLFSDNLYSLLLSYPLIESALLVLKKLRAGSTGFIDCYRKVWNQIDDTQHHPDVWVRIENKKRM